MIIEVKDTSEAFDFMWKLSQDKAKGSYHKIASKDDLEKKIEHAIQSDIHRAILCYEDEQDKNDKDKSYQDKLYVNKRLKGAAIYFWEEEYKYVQTTVFLIDEDYNNTADEIIEYIRKHLPVYELLIGVPFSNIEANEYLRRKNYKCIESSYDTRLRNRKDNVKHVNAEIKRLSMSEFDEFATFHDTYAKKLEMYWTSDRIKEDFHKFRIYVYYEDGVKGSIFVAKYPEGAEINALFIDENYIDKGIDEALIQYMLDSVYEEDSNIKEVVYFIEEENHMELEVALTLGFEISDTYRCYRCEL